jgi:hypothetical protein
MAIWYSLWPFCVFSRFGTYVWVKKNLATLLMYVCTIVCMQILKEPENLFKAGQKRIAWSASKMLFQNFHTIRLF